MISILLHACYCVSCYLHVFYTFQCPLGLGPLAKPWSWAALTVQTLNVFKIKLQSKKQQQTKSNRYYCLRAALLAKAVVSVYVYGMAKLPLPLVAIGLDEPRAEG